jgi:tetratricopeptide (TPR) repeat protein
MWYKHSIADTTRRKDSPQRGFNVLKTKTQKRRAKVAGNRAVAETRWERRATTARRSRATSKSTDRRRNRGRASSVRYSNGKRPTAKRGRNSNGNHLINARLAAALKQFEHGVLLFQKQNYAKAKEVFQRLAEGPADEVTARARTYLRMCESKLVPATPAPKSAQDFYNLGIAQLNARELKSAIENLRRADRLEPRRGDFRYALAVANALQDNAEPALEYLKAAIELDSRNALLARRDEDFQSLASDPRFQRLIFGAE